MINSPVSLDFNGLNLTKLRVQLQILCWSPYDGRDDITNCCARGVHEVLVKPYKGGESANLMHFLN